MNLRFTWALCAAVIGCAASDDRPEVDSIDQAIETTTTPTTDPPPNGLEVEQLSCPRERATLAEIERILARLDELMTGRGCAGLKGLPGYKEKAAASATCGGYGSPAAIAGELSCEELDTQRSALNTLAGGYRNAMRGRIQRRECWDPAAPDALPRKREDVKLQPSCGNPANEPSPNFNCTQQNLIDGTCFECRPKTPTGPLTSMSCASPIMAGLGVGSQGGEVECRRVDTTCVKADVTNGEARCKVADATLNANEKHLGILLFSPGVPLAGWLSVAGMGGGGYSWHSSVDFEVSIDAVNSKGWGTSCKVGDTLCTSPDSKYFCKASAKASTSTSMSGHIDVFGSGGGVSSVDTSSCFASREEALPAAQACYAMSAVENLCKDFGARVRAELTAEVKACIERKIPLIDGGKNECVPVVWDKQLNIVPNGGDKMCNNGETGPKRCVYVPADAQTQVTKGVWACVGPRPYRDYYRRDDNLPAGSLGAACYRYELFSVNTQPDPYACSAGLSCVANPEYSRLVDIEEGFELDPPYICARDPAKFGKDVCSTVALSGRSAADVARALKLILDNFAAVESAWNGQQDGLLGLVDLDAVCARGAEPLKGAACFLRSTSLNQLMDIADHAGNGPHDGLSSQGDVQALLAYVIACGGPGMEELKAALPKEVQLTGQMVKSQQDSGQCLTHAGNGNDVSVAPCDPKNPNQRWSIQTVAQASGESTLVFRPQSDTSLCIDMHQSEKVGDNGYRAYLHPCHGGDNQKFVHKDGKLMQRFTRNNYCLDWWVGQGGTVHMPTCHDSAYGGFGTTGPNQKWSIE